MLIPPNLQLPDMNLILVVTDLLALNAMIKSWSSTMLNYRLILPLEPSTVKSMSTKLDLLILPLPSAVSFKEEPNLSKAEIRLKDPRALTLIFSVNSKVNTLHATPKLINIELITPEFKALSKATTTKLPPFKTMLLMPPTKFDLLINN